jgi:DnaJ-domain-containing protein 1
LNRIEKLFDTAEKIASKWYKNDESLLLQQQQQLERSQQQYNTLMSKCTTLQASLAAQQASLDSEKSKFQQIVDEFKIEQQQVQQLSIMHHTITSLNKMRQIITL